MMIRAKYTKMGDMVYLSHLDLVRLFERAFRRASVPLAFTQGFNPHPMIAFAAPLSVGISSTAEYVDVVLSEPMDPAAFMQQMNETLPTDLQLLAAVLKDEKGTASLMQEAELMTYEISFLLQKEISEKQISDHITNFLNQDQVIIEKKAKPKKGNKRFGKSSKAKQVDILPLIHQFKLLSKTDHQVTFLLAIYVVNQETVKPALIMEAWIKHGALTVLQDSMDIERKEISKKNLQQVFVPLL